MRNLAWIGLGLGIVFIATGVFAAEDAAMKEALGHLREYSSIVHGKEEALRLLQLDLERAKLELEIKKISNEDFHAGLSGIVSGVDKTGDKPARLPVLSLRNVVTGSGGKQARILVDDRSFLLKEGDTFCGFCLKTLNDDSVVVTSSQGENIILRTGS